MKDYTKLAELSIEIGPAPITVSSMTRNPVRKWIIANGSNYAAVQNLTVAELSRLYNDEEALAAFLAVQTPEPSPEPEPSPQPQPEKPKAMQTQPQATPPATSAQAAALQALLATLTPQTAPLDEARIVELIKEHAPTAEPRQWTIQVGNREPVTMSRQHFAFPLLLATMAAKVPAYLVGPAGTGKTSAAHSAAEALGLEFGAISVGPMTSKSDLFGMRDANGIYHESLLVKIATAGGIFLFDEFDAGNPATLTAVNMLLANGSFATPDGMREKSPDFTPVFALNTYGTGASREYVGRNQLDAATLDRGAFIDWPLDEGLEASFLGLDRSSPSFALADGGTPSPGEWLDTVQRTRRAVAAAGLRHIISPRATLYGAAMAAAGIGRKHLSQTLLIKGLDATAAGKIISNN